MLWHLILEMLYSVGSLALFVTRNNSELLPEESQDTKSWNIDISNLIDSICSFNNWDSKLRG